MYGEVAFATVDSFFFLPASESSSVNAVGWFACFHDQLFNPLSKRRSRYFSRTDKTVQKRDKQGQEENIYASVSCASVPLLISGTRHVYFILFYFISWMKSALVNILI